MAVPPEFLVKELQDARAFEEMVEKDRALINADENGIETKDAHSSALKQVKVKQSNGPRMAGKEVPRVAGKRPPTWTRSTPSPTSPGDETAEKQKVNPTSKSTPRVRFQEESDAGGKKKDEQDDTNYEKTSSTLLDHVRSSTNLARKRVKTSKSEVANAEQTVKDLTLTIRMKEGLIKELVKNGIETRDVNEGVVTRMKTMEAEKDMAVGELKALKGAFEKLMKEGGGGGGEG